MKIDLLEFAIDDQRYAVRLDDLVEVVRAVAIVRLPAAPGIVEGVIDLRGRIVPVVDLRSRFGHPPRPLDSSQAFIIARAGTRVIAMRADRAVELQSVDEKEIESLQSNGRRARHVGGLARTASGIVVVQDVAAFLDDSEGEALDAALAGAESGRK